MTGAPTRRRAARSALARPVTMVVACATTAL